MSGVLDVDPILTCPYNPSHEVSKSRMQYHLVKCSKSFPNVERETCPFNATHRVPRPEKKFHLENCADRRVVEAAKYQPEGEIGNGTIRSYEKPDLPPSEENWDEDICSSSYQPLNSVSHTVKLRNLAGATKSERKQFRQQERRRVANLNNENNEEPEPRTIPASSHLRLPKETSKSLKGFIGSNLGMGRGLSIRIISPEANDTIDDFSYRVCFGRGAGKK